MLKFLVPLLAALHCEQISENVWECTADDSGGWEDHYPVEPDPSNPGSYICTNCISISSTECESIKTTLLGEVSSILSQVQTSQSLVSDTKTNLRALIDDLGRFVSCPYSFIENNRDFDSQPGYDSSLSTVPARLSDFWNKMKSAWHNSANYQFLGIEPHDPSGFTWAPVKYSANYLVGVWECSYRTANSVNAGISDLLNTLDNAERSLNDVSDVSIPLLNYNISSVSCAPCSLSSSGGSGGSGDSGDSGETGTETGCLTCYTKYLKSLDESVDSINNHVHEINTKVSTFIDDVTDAIKDNLDIPLSSISNTIQRIDDYLRVDQDRLLDSIRSAVVVISNEVSDIQNNFYTSFKRADEFKNLDNQEFSLVEAIKEIPQGGDSVWSRLNWFSRMEALLASIAGFGTNTADVASEVSSEVMEEYDQNMASVRSDSSGLAAREQISTAMDSVSSVLQSFQIFDGVHEPEAIRLLDAADVPFLSGANGAQLTIEMPNVPAIYSFLRFVRYAFIALYWTASLLSFFFSLLGLYAGVVSLVKWASQFLGSVFAS